MSSSEQQQQQQVWIYHERQEALLCGQHALNNLLQQGPVLTPGDLAEIAHQLDAMELEFMAQNNEGGIYSKDYIMRQNEGSNNVDAAGNFSIQVLKTALTRQIGNALGDNTEDCLPHYTPQLVSQYNLNDVTEIQGFLCHKSDHWFAIREIGGRFWNLNSMFEKGPVPVSHFQLGKEMDNFRDQGYTIFCVIRGLTPVGHTGPYAPPHVANAASAAGHLGTWHCMTDILQNKMPTVEEQAAAAYALQQNGSLRTEKPQQQSKMDPWQNLKGQGMRLDGKSSSSSSTTTNAMAAVTMPANVDGLTEDEQLALALQMSEQQTMEAVAEPVATAASLETFEIPPEPEATAPKTTRIQFRLPNNKRVVRKFHLSDPVGGLYAYCQDQLRSTTKKNDNNQAIDLKAGFPPKSLSDQKSKSLQDAQFGPSEAIQVQFL